MSDIPSNNGMQYQQPNVAPTLPSIHNTQQPYPTSFQPPPPASDAAQQQQHQQHQQHQQQSPNMSVPTSSAVANNSMPNPNAQYNLNPPQYPTPPPVQIEQQQQPNPSTDPTGSGSPTANSADVPLAPSFHLVHRVAYELDRISGSDDRQFVEQRIHYAKSYLTQLVQQLEYVQNEYFDSATRRRSKRMSNSKLANYDENGSNFSGGEESNMQNEVITPTNAASSTGGRRRPERSNTFKPFVHTILQTWFKDHWQDPYPSDKEKVDLLDQTGITMDQLNHWFINERYRKWRQYRKEGGDPPGKRTKREQASNGDGAGSSSFVSESPRINQRPQRSTAYKGVAATAAQLKAEGSPRKTAGGADATASASEGEEYGTSNPLSGLLAATGMLNPGEEGKEGAASPDGGDDVNPLKIIQGSLLINISRRHIAAIPQAVEFKWTVPQAESSGLSKQEASRMTNMFIYFFGPPYKNHLYISLRELCMLLHISIDAIPLVLRQLDLPPPHYAQMPALIDDKTKLTIVVTVAAALKLMDLSPRSDRDMIKHWFTQQIGIITGNRDDNASVGQQPMLVDRSDVLTHLVAQMGKDSSTDSDFIAANESHVPSRSTQQPQRSDAQPAAAKSQAQNNGEEADPSVSVDGSTIKIKNLASPVKSTPRDSSSQVAPGQPPNVSNMQLNTWASPSPTPTAAMSMSSANHGHYLPAQVQTPNNGQPQYYTQPPNSTTPTGSYYQQPQFFPQYQQPQHPYYMQQGGHPPALDSTASKDLNDGLELTTPHNQAHRDSISHPQTPLMNMQQYTAYNNYQPHSNVPWTPNHPQHSMQPPDNKAANEPDTNGNMM